MTYCEFVRGSLVKSSWFIRVCSLMQPAAFRRASPEVKTTNIHFLFKFLCSRLSSLHVSFLHKSCIQCPIIYTEFKSRSTTVLFIRNYSKMYFFVLAVMFRCKFYQVYVAGTTLISLYCNNCWCVVSDV